MDRLLKVYCLPTLVIAASVGATPRSRQSAKKPIKQSTVRIAQSSSQK
jgi:hypothetical protein